MNSPTILSTPEQLPATDQPDYDCPSTPSRTRREKLTPKKDLTLNLVSKSDSPKQSIRKEEYAVPVLSQIEGSTTTSDSDSDSMSSQKDSLSLPLPRTPAPRTPIRSARGTPHYSGKGGVTPRTPRFKFSATSRSPSPSSRRTPHRRPRTPRTPRTPCTPGTTDHPSEDVLLPERCQSVPPSEDWMLGPRLMRISETDLEAEMDSEDADDAGSVCIELECEFDFTEEGEDDVYADDEKEWNSKLEDDAFEEEDMVLRSTYWMLQQTDQSPEEYALMLEEMRKEAEVSVCTKMMEQLELRDLFERAVDEMTRVKPEPEREWGLRRRRTIG